jgi:hypothetical protein
MRDAGKLAKGSRGRFAGGGKKTPPAKTLESQGVDKDLAKAARKDAEKRRIQGGGLHELGAP